MRGKDYSTGLRGGLFERQHYARMGSALWLYGWLVLRQTNQRDGIGWVLGGTPITYREIEEETGFNSRTLERWMRDLRRAGYIETDVVAAGIVVRITKAKKFPQSAQGGRKFEGGVRRLAEPQARSCVANRSEDLSRQEVTDGIGSSFIERSIEKETKSEIHRDFHSTEKNQKNRQENPSWLEQNQNTKTNTWPNTPRE
jgi:DNA-binding transcriptional regulator YhcF (GntR family)